MRVRSTEICRIDSVRFAKIIEKKGYKKAQLSKIIGASDTYIKNCINNGKIGTKQLSELEKRCGFKREDFLAKDGQYTLCLDEPITQTKAAGVYDVPKALSDTREAIIEHIGNIAAELEKLKEDLEKWQEAQYNLK